MQHRDPSPPPGDRARRRGLFSGRTDPPPTPHSTGLSPAASERAEVVITAYQEMIQEQLDEGLRAIQHTANSLMHEIAAEVWRGAGGDKEAVGSAILQELSRDQAIRALISHSDERFQSLAARTGRLEDTMNMLAETVRGAREQLERGIEALADAPGSPVGLEQIRKQLQDMSRHLGVAFQTLADRDQAIVDTVHERVREHGELITRETARIAQAMEAYVQQGVVAMGNLAGDTGTEIASISERQQALADHIEESVLARMDALGEQVRTLVAGDVELGEQVRALVAGEVDLADRVQALIAREAELAERLKHAVETPVGQLGEQVRSIAELERQRIAELEESVGARFGELGAQVQQMAERDGELAGHLDRTIAERMEQLGEQMQLLYDRTAISASTLNELVSGFGDRVSGDTKAAVAALMTTIEERVSGLASLVRSDSEALRSELARRTTDMDERLGHRLDEGLSHAMDQTLATIDRNMIRMVDALDVHFDRLGVGVGDRAANAAELAIGARFDDVLARLHGSAQVIERGGSQIAERFTALDDRLSSFDERFAGTDQRFAALAKLVRSDSERIAEQILADQEVTKQALRAMKELQASLPVEVVQMVEERFTSLAESIERSNEMLAGRIDRMAETIGQRQNDDIQVVIDRMGDAMHALASLGKGGDPPADPRIEIG